MSQSRIAVLLIGILTTCAAGQLVYVKCCTKLRPNPCVMGECLMGGGPGRPYPYPQGGICRRYAPVSSCVYGFEYTGYSLVMADNMCGVDTILPDQSDSQCESWSEYTVPGIVCGTYQVVDCLLMFDLDSDGDVDLKDWATYQNKFADWRPVP